MKKFKVVNGPDVRIALLTGHVYHVTKDWKEIPEKAYAAAYSQGCISEDMVNNQAQVGLTTAVLSTIEDMALDKKDIHDVIQKAMDDGDVGFFTISGTPKIPKVNGALGRVMDSDLIREVWAEMTADRDIEIDLDSE